MPIIRLHGALPSKNVPYSYPKTFVRQKSLVQSQAQDSNRVTPTQYVQLPVYGKSDLRLLTSECLLLMAINIIATKTSRDHPVFGIRGMERQRKIGALWTAASPSSRLPSLQLQLNIPSNWRAGAGEVHLRWQAERN